MQNISEFERTKPKETYKNLRELRGLLDGYIQTLPSSAGNIWAAAIRAKLNELEANFLKGM